MSSLLRLSWALCVAVLFGVALNPAPSYGQDAPFITVWDTENAGESNDDQIIIPGEGTDYIIEWEEVDNTSNNGSETVAEGDTTLTFPNPGVYRVNISGDFTRIHFGKYSNTSSEGDGKKITKVTQWGNIEWSTMEGAFFGASNLNLFADIGPELSKVVSMKSMFQGTSSLTAAESSIGTWDTSNVEDMSKLFSGASSFNQDVGQWDTENVTNMYRMFINASSFNQDIGRWETGNVENMAAMFWFASKFNQDINGWDTGNVKTMVNMFRQSESFNNDLNEWNTSSVENMRAMFLKARDFNGYISDWDVSDVKNFSAMFSNADSFDKDIVGWNTKSADDMSVMFRGAESFNQDIGGWETGSVTDMGSMFRRAVSFDQDIGGWNTASVTDMSQMFSGQFSDPTPFNQDISGWDTGNVTDMRSMFEQARSFNQDIGGWDTGNVKDMSKLFRGAASFNQDLTKWDTGSVTKMTRMFASANDFNHDLGNWDTGEVRTMRGMFQGARSFNQDISGWDTGNVTTMDGMFRAADSFDQDLGTWDVSSVVSEEQANDTMEEIFSYSGLSPTNYDRTIIGWSQKNLETGVQFGAEEITYCNSEPFRYHLKEGFNWTISDSGQETDCPDVLAASDANQIDSDGTFEFGETGLDITVSGLVGTGLVTVARFSDAPRNVDQGTPKPLRLIVAAGGLTSFEEAELRFNVNQLDGLDQPSETLVFSRPQPGSGSFDQLPTTFDLVEGELIATTDSFSEIAFASEDDPLPVELASFEGVTTEGSVRLTWQTATETNNSGFDVQRRVGEPGKAEGSWTTIDFVEGAGTTSKAQSYLFTDTNLPYDAGRLTYRLRQVDTDGTTTLSDPITIERGVNEAELLGTFPNPASQQATVRYALPERQEVEVRLYDALGRQVRTIVNGQKEGRHEETVDVSGLPSGTYFLRLKTESATKSQQVTVVR